MKRKKSLIIIGIPVALLIIGGAFAFSQNRTPTYETIIAKRGEFIQEVNVTGKVKAAIELELAFPFEGTIRSIFAREGQSVVEGAALVALDTRGLAIDRDEAAADVALRRAELDKLLARPTILPDASTLDVESEYIDLLNALNDVLIAITSARNTLIMITGNNDFMSTRPDRQKLREAANSVMTDALVGLYTNVNQTPSTSEIEEFRKVEEVELLKVSEALLLFDASVNAALPNANVTQAQLDSYAAEIRSRKTSVQGAQAKVQTEKVDVANALLAADKDYAIAEARLKAAEAKLRAVEKKISDSTLRAAVNGVVTDVNKEIGERVAQSEIVLDLLASDLLVEAEISESDIPAIEVGDTARITLDAYGSDQEFGAVVRRIDPAETVVEGISTYRTTFRFDKPDGRIKSGMTANVSILTDKREGVLAIPGRAITNASKKKTVGILTASGTIEEREVETGLRASDGTVEILKGIEEGEEVIVSPVK